jgi:transposase InsO family protein
MGSSRGTAVVAGLPRGGRAASTARLGDRRDAGSRFGKIPERHRPYYPPVARFRILEIRGLLAWSAHETARVFLVCPNTILNWDRMADPSARAVGSCVKPQPPVRRAADVVRSVVQLMSRLGFGGQDLTARILARAGWRISARSVGRYRRERVVAPPPPPAQAAPPPHPVVARFVHHVWMMDLSEVKQFLGPPLHLAAVFDAFSRAPLALEVSRNRPTAKRTARLLALTARRFASPRYVITDRGGEFFHGAFARTVRRLGAIQRFASTESLFATARLERFWRNLKETAGLYRLHLPLTREDLEHRLELALLHYLCFRPHEGLEGATAAEAFLGTEPAHRSAREPPRGRPGEGPREAPFRVGHLDPDHRRLPILTPAA